MALKANLGTRLGLIAAGHLALHSDEGWIGAETISKEYEVPLLYLLKIMQQMVKANVLRSKRGPHGGFRLARLAKEITLLEIIEVAEGPLAERNELTDMQTKDLFKPDLEETLNRGFEKATSVLGKATLGQMVGK